MRILYSCVAGLPIWLFWSQMFKFWLFLNTFGFFGNEKSQKICLFLAYLQSHRLGSVKTLYELDIHYQPLVTRVYYHARCTEYCKHFSAALKMIYAIDKKQMHDSVITGKEYASKDWACVISMFLTSFNVHCIWVVHASCACASQLLSGFFGTRYGFFWWRQVGNPVV